MPTARGLPARVHPKRSASRLLERRTLGFLTDSLTDHYQLSLLAGAAACARAREVNVIAFAARALGLNAAVDGLVGPENVHALVATAPTLGNRIGIEGVAAYLRGLGSLPMCFIGAEVPGIPAVLSDNRSGMRDAVRHLIRVHQKKRIAFIGGIVGNAEAETRLQVYRQVLQDHGLAVDESLVGVGDFVRHAATRAMDEILGRGVGPDAVAAASDMMALGAIDALGAHGIEVPEQVAVVGFDDIEEGRFSVPTLTSVRQPLDTQGREAARIVLDALELGQPGKTVTVNLELMVRSSCGCVGGASGLGVTRPRSGGSFFEGALLQRRSLILAEIARAGQGALGWLGPNWAEKLLQALMDELRGVRPGGFRRTLEELLASSRASGGQLVLWQRVLSVLRAETRQAIGANVERLGAAEDVFHEAREAVAMAMEHEQAMARLSMAHGVRLLRESGVAFAAVRDHEELLRVLVEHLDLLGFRRAYVALREPDPKFSQLLLGWDRDLPLEPASRAPRFPTALLAPTDLRSPNEPGTWVVLPLIGRAGQFGHIILDADTGEGLVWETLCLQISTALEMCSGAGEGA
jgi:sigma-B regulation protein RsbU (phosphoserine phosphatase)